MHILIIEDNRDLAANMFDFLEANGHAVDMAADGITGLHLAIVNHYDAIVLDLMLPGMDGTLVCKKLRQEAGKDTPVLMITARDSLDDKITGLEAGADDYLVKPAELREIEMRLRVLSRRGSARVMRQKLTIADLTLDPSTYIVHRGSKHIELPPIPYKILELLMLRSPQVVTREEIEHTVWGDALPDSDSLRAHMHVLRTLIDKPFETSLLHTMRGFGYQLASKDATDK
jgi:DNA-binding response OmpR family regulator